MPGQVIIVHIIIYCITFLNVPITINIRSVNFTMSYNSIRADNSAAHREHATQQFTRYGTTAGVELKLGITPSEGDGGSPASHSV